MVETTLTLTSGHPKVEQVIQKLTVAHKSENTVNSQSIKQGLHT